MAGNDPHGLVGEILNDKYEVLSVVGDGGFSTVYRARHRLWNRPVALKVLSGVGLLGREEQAQIVEAFLREGAILAELSERSPAICQARDVGTVNVHGSTLTYLVLEWLDGSTLADLLDVETALGRRPRSLLEAVRLLRPIADALAVAHQRGVVHRDIKPANIFVLDDPAKDNGTQALKLLDFGVAKVFAGRALAPGAPTQTTGPLTAFTPAYAAPEQFSRALGGTGPWTDVYAFALVLLEIVTGREPQGGVDVATIAKVALDPRQRPTPRKLGLAVDDAVEAVFVRALEVSTEKRFADVAIFWGALHAALDLDAFVPPVLSTPYVRPPPSPDFFSAPTLDPASVRAREVDPMPSPASLHSPPLRRRYSLVLGLCLLAFGGASLSVGAFVPRPHAAPPSSELATSTSRPSVSTDPPSPTAKSRACREGTVPVPGGPFFMGAEEGTPVERPVHQVTLAPFCMDRFEVTVAAYKDCSDKGECKRAGTMNAWEDISASEAATFDPLCNGRDPESRGRHPVNCVDWSMAEHYCEVGGGRLPTEAEWELAARGPDGRTYPWGDAPPGPQLLNACGPECVAWGKAHGQEERPMYASSDGFATTAPVGSFPLGASRYGVEDIAGNVWEWVGDWYGSYANEGGLAQQDPHGPTEGTEKVVRGGAWNGADPAWVRPTFRFKSRPSHRSYGIGFRCVGPMRTRS